MWSGWALLVVAASAQAASFSCPPICPVRNADRNDTTPMYTIQGTAAMKLNNTHLSVDCKSHNIDYRILPKLNTSLEELSFINCTLSPTTIKQIIMQLNVTIKQLSLKHWSLDHRKTIESSVNFTTITINATNNDIPNDFFNSIDNLTGIEITNGKLRVLDIDFPANIQLLNLSNNNIEYVPNLFLHNKTVLEVLSFSRNAIKNLSDNVFIEQKLLKTLDLSYNQLSELRPDWFSSLTNLQNLYLQGNKIVKLQSTLFEKLTNLIDLHLENNFIEVLNKEVLTNQVKLLRVNLSHNRLTQIEHYAFFGPPGSLTHLDLSYNLLTDLCPSRGTGSPLHLLTNLQHLDLQHNRLTHGCWPSKWEHLLTLDYSYNAFPNLTYYDFDFPSTNVTVDYRHNNINSVIFSEYEKSAKFASRKFLLDSNKLICDGYMYWFVKLTQEMDLFNKSNVEDVTCAAPEKVYNEKLSALKLHDLTYTVDCNVRNDSLKGCNCEYFTESKEFTLDCNSVNKPNLKAFVTEGMRIVLKLENTNLTVIEDLPQNVTALHVAHNNISFVPVLPNTLEYIDLRYNNLTSYTSQLIEHVLSSVRRVRLSHNPWRCDCDNRDLLAAIIARPNQVLDYEEVQCSNGTALSSVRISALCPDRTVLIAVLCSLALLAAAVVTLVSCYYKYRLEVEVILYKWGIRKNGGIVDEIDKDKKYDVFVSFSHGDEDFVNNQLMPKLEGGPHKFFLCVHHRDWVVGDKIPTQIIRSVENSKRIVIVFSKHFLKSLWGLMEFQIAINETIKSGLYRIIVIKMPDVTNLDGVPPEIKSYLTENTYLERTDTLFWDKLYFSLGKGEFRHKMGHNKFMVPLTIREERLRKRHLKSLVNFINKTRKELEKEKENKDNVQDLVYNDMNLNLEIIGNGVLKKGKKKSDNKDDIVLNTFVDIDLNEDIAEVNL